MSFAQLNQLTTRTIDWMDDGVRRELSCPECHRILWKGDRYWLCAYQHGRLIPQEILVGRLIDLCMEEEEAMEILHRLAREQREPRKRRSRKDLLSEPELPLIWY